MSIDDQQGEDEKEVVRIELPLEAASGVIFLRVVVLLFLFLKTYIICVVSHHYCFYDINIYIYIYIY